VVFSRPAYGLALLTYPASDLVVLDFDGVHAESVWNLYTGVALPPTARTRTRSGGSHRVFRMPPASPTLQETKRKIKLVKAEGCGCEKVCGVDLLVNGYFVAPPTPGYTEDPDSPPLEPGGLAVLPLEVFALIGREHNGGGPAVARAAGEYAELLAGVPRGMQHDTSVKLIGHLLPKLGFDETWTVMEGWCERCTPPADKRKVRANLEDIARAEGKKERADTSAVLVTLSSVAPEPVAWLWPGRVAKGKLTLNIGNPDMGKSALTLDLAARVSTGAFWPDGTKAPKGDVILLTAEDGLADTVRPRLDAMGGDPARVHVLQAIRDKIGERGVDLTRDVAHLEAAIVHHRAELVIVDPLNAYLGKTDSTQDVNVRRVLAPLAALAERTGVALVVVMHLTKDSQRAAIFRAQGSIGFVAAARAVFVVAEEPTNGEQATEQSETEQGSARRIFAPVKMNIAAKPPALAFTLHPEGESIKVVWDPTPQHVNVNTLLGDYEPPREGGAREAAADFLRTILAEGPVESKRVVAQARAEGISRTTLFRAKHDLRVVHNKLGFEGGFTWGLPPPRSVPSVPKLPGGGIMEHFAERQQLSGLKDGGSPKCSNNPPPETLGNELEEVEVEGLS